MQESIINSRLFKKIQDSDTFFGISDLVKQIYDDLRDNRDKILSLLEKAMVDSDDLKDAIKDFNEISELPNVMIFGDIPNKYLQNLNDNVQAHIQLLNAIQRLQSNWVKKNEGNKGKKPDGNSEDDWNINNFIDIAGIGSESKDGIVVDG